MVYNNDILTHIPTWFLEGEINEEISSQIPKQEKKLLITCIYGGISQISASFILMRYKENHGKCWVSRDWGEELSGEKKVPQVMGIRPWWLLWHEFLFKTEPRDRNDDAPFENGPFPSKHDTSSFLLTCLMMPFRHSSASFPSSTLDIWCSSCPFSPPASKNILRMREEPLLA